MSDMSQTPVNRRLEFSTKSLNMGGTMWIKIKLDAQACNVYKQKPIDENNIYDIVRNRIVYV